MKLRRDDTARRVDRDYLRLLEQAAKRPRNFRQRQVVHCLRHGVSTIRDLRETIGCNWQAVREAVRELRRSGYAMIVDRDLLTGEPSFALTEKGEEYDEKEATE
jgi:predicted transcriptional regulator